MAIATYTHTPEPATVVEDTTLTDSSTIDNTEIPLASLRRYVDYPTWNVDYYAQILGSTDPSIPHDSLLPDVLQPYTVIRDYSLKLSESFGNITYTDEDTIDFTGSAIYLGPIKPNNGDMIVGTATGSRKAIFTVTEVKTLSVMKNPLYEIGFSFVRFVDTADGKRAYIDLESKVVRIRYYVESLNCQGATLMTETSFQSTQNLESLITDSINRYLNMFLDRESLLLVIPGQSERIYDPWITDYIQRTGNVHKYPRLATIRQENVEDDPCLSQYTIWSALLDKDLDILPIANSKIGMVSTNQFYPVFMTDVVRYGWVTKVMYPLVPMDTSPYFTTCKNASVSTITDAVNQGPSLAFITSPSDIGDIPKVLDDDYYIFSRDFYYGGDITILEQEVRKYINNEKPNINIVSTYLKESKKWGLLEQFYYLPILWSLATANL